LASLICSLFAEVNATNAASMFWRIYFLTISLFLNNKETLITLGCLPFSLVADLQFGDSICK
jgi:hypothetical protein